MQCSIADEEAGAAQVINVHRLSWAKLISFEESSPVTALAWSSDGKTIASGHEDGSLHLIDAETVHSTRARCHFLSLLSISMALITCLSLHF